MARALGRTEGLRWGLAVHDLVALTYLSAITAGLWWLAPHGHAAPWATAVWALVATVVILTRAHPRPGRAFGLSYRIALTCTLVGSYLLEGAVLAAVNGRTMDAQLSRIDLALFGVDWSAGGPKSPFWVEYFSCFYLGYFAVLAFYAAPRAVFGQDARAATELAITMILVYAIGQTLYVVIPAYGPGPQFGTTHELARGPFSSYMIATIDAVGAQKDVFPSLHVAGTAASAIHALRHPARGRLRWLGPACLAFVAANILAATLYLRWHYVIDVVAGLALALSADRASVALAGWELRRRERDGLQPAWPAS